MKTILVDAVNTFVVDGKVDTALYTLLETYLNRKIVVTNANDEQVVEFGLTDLPYELFTLKHEPDKVVPLYFKTLLQKYSLKPDGTVYFEHNPDAVKSAGSVGINSYHFDHKKRDLTALKQFLDRELDAI